MFANCPNLAEVTFGHGFYASDKISELPAGHNWVFRDNPGYVYTSSALKTAMRGKTALEGTYIWATDVYTVNFEGGSPSVAGSMGSRTVANLSADYVIPENRFVNPGYAFTGWMAKSGEEFKLDGGRAVIPAGTYGNGSVVTLIAQWEEDPGSEDPGPGIDPGADPGFRLPDTGGTGEWPFRPFHAAGCSGAALLPRLSAASSSASLADLVLNSSSMANGFAASAFADSS